jgi:hypothetical protein
VWRSAPLASNPSVGSLLQVSTGIAILKNKRNDFVRTFTYLAHPTLDCQGSKPIPELCLACHGGYYSPRGTAKVSGAIFLAFDLDSFLYDTQGDPHRSSTAQEEFRQLNNIVRNSNPDGQTGDTNKPITELMNLWYPTGVANTGAQFSFNHRWQRTRAASSVTDRATRMW